MDILQILQENGVEIPKDKKKLEKQLRQHYKSASEVKKLNDKITTLETEKANAEDLFKTASAELDGYKDMDIEEIKQSTEKYKTTIKEMEKKYKEDLQLSEYKRLVDNKLSDEKFNSKLAKQGIASIMYSKNLKVDNDTIIGYDDVYKVVKEENADSYIIEDKPNDETTIKVDMGGQHTDKKQPKSLTDKMNNMILNSINK